MHSISKDNVLRGTSANSLTTLLWTEKERKEVCMLMSEMSMMNLKMVSITEVFTVDCNVHV